MECDTNLRRNATTGDSGRTRPTRLGILGATGSIGQQTLAVVRDQPDHYRVIGLAAARPSEALRALADEFQPACVVVANAADRAVLAGEGRTVLAGADGLLQLATDPAIDLLVVASAGHAGIAPTLAALRAGKQLALANKETIVCAGALVVEAARTAGVTIRPVDSEHSAIWQCLGFGQAAHAVQRLTLTASGGPFRTWPAEALASVTVDQALAHPTWRMGGKITVDSATLMNKGLEVIEAHWLFGAAYDQIEVLVHPQSIVHSLVEFVDGSVLAQLGLPDMRLPIHVALAYPERLPTAWPRLDLAARGHLDFEPPRLDAFPCLRLAYQAGRAGDTYPTVLSAADEVAVEQFLAGAVTFNDIPRLIESALNAHVPIAHPTLDDILDTDRRTRAAMRAHNGAA